MLSGFSNTGYSWSIEPKHPKEHSAFYPEDPLLTLSIKNNHTKTLIFILTSLFQIQYVLSSLLLDNLGQLFNFLSECMRYITLRVLANNDENALPRESDVQKNAGHNHNIFSNNPNISLPFFPINLHIIIYITYFLWMKEIVCLLNDNIVLWDVI